LEKRREGFSVVNEVPDWMRGSKDLWSELEEDMKVTVVVVKIGHAKTQDHLGGVQVVWGVETET
jgi:hypothetical protein